MFCIQCEQTLASERATGCQFKKGKCGKTAETADLQDLLIYLLQGIGQFAHRARGFGLRDDAVDRFVPHAFFTTLTNVNFDSDRIIDLIHQAARLRDRARQLYLEGCREAGESPEALEGPATLQPGSTEERLLEDFSFRVRNLKQGPDGLLYVLTENGGLHRLGPATAAEP